MEQSDYDAKVQKAQEAESLLFLYKYHKGAAVIKKKKNIMNMIFNKIYSSVK